MHGNLTVAHIADATDLDKPKFRSVRNVHALFQRVARPRAKIRAPFYASLEPRARVRACFAPTLRCVLGTRCGLCPS